MEPLPLRDLSVTFQIPLETTPHTVPHTDRPLRSRRGRVSRGSNRHRPVDSSGALIKIQSAYPQPDFDGDRKRLRRENFECLGTLPHLEFTPSESDKAGSRQPENSYFYFELFIGSCPEIESNPRYRPLQKNTLNQQKLDAQSTMGVKINRLRDISWDLLQCRRSGFIPYVLTTEGPILYPALDCSHRDLVDYGGKREKKENNLEAAWREFQEESLQAFNSVIRETYGSDQLSELNQKPDFLKNICLASPSKFLVFLRLGSKVSPESQPSAETVMSVKEAQKQFEQIHRCFRNNLKALGSQVYIEVSNIVPINFHNLRQRIQDLAVFWKTANLITRAGMIPL